MAKAGSEILIQLEHVWKRYGEKLAVSDLSLEIRAGELFAFLGPNGAGKTTTIKMITGLLRASSGRVLVAGHDIANRSEEARRQISYVPDHPHLYGKLTGREFLGFIRDIYGLSGPVVAGDEKRLIETFEMTDYIEDLIETYSHGMRQRLTFASALLHRPRVLVVDEPMVGLDPKSTRIVKDLLRDCARNGTAVFVSTHTLSIAEELADRIGIIHHGLLICCATLAELREETNAAGSLEEFFLKVTADGSE